MSVSLRFWLAKFASAASAYHGLDFTVSLRVGATARGPSQRVVVLTICKAQAEAGAIGDAIRAVAEKFREFAGVTMMQVLPNRCDVTTAACESLGMDKFEDDDGRDMYMARFCVM